MSIKVYIDGGEGTTGLMLKQRLLFHPEVKLLISDLKKRKNLDYRLDNYSKADLVFLCLPDEVSIETMDIIEKSSKSDLIIIDASSAHRIHSKWIYGFPELNSSQRGLISKSKRISNPGCYSTAAISIIRPLIESEVLFRDSPLVIHAVSGFTGGGKKLIKYFKNIKREQFFHYSMFLKHKHVNEIVHYSLLNKIPIFCPSVGNFPQGMTVSLPVHYEWCRENISGEIIRDKLYQWYEKEKFVSINSLNNLGVLTKEGYLSPEDFVGTNQLEISIFSNEKLGQAWIFARLDNLGKGASGAAVQNMNIVFGYGEDLGLKNVK